MFVRARMSTEFPSTMSDRSDALDALSFHRTRASRPHEQSVFNSFSHVVRKQPNTGVRILITASIRKGTDKRPTKGALAFFFIMRCLDSKVQGERQRVSFPRVCTPCGDTRRCPAPGVVLFLLHDDVEFTTAMPAPTLSRLLDGHVRRTTHRCRFGRCPLCACEASLRFLWAATACYAATWRAWDPCAEANAQK